MSGSIVSLSTAGSAGGQPDPGLLGGKGAGLVTLCQLGLPVPPGFILCTDAARARPAGALPEAVAEGVREALAALERESDRGFGSRRRPLLLAVRSGAPDSMPGMMDTILNVGLNDETVDGLARVSGNPRFAWDSYRRLVMMYGESVAHVPRAAFDRLLARRRDEQGLEYDWELDAATLAALTREFLDLVAAAGAEFPQDPVTQLFAAIQAVFASWNSERARAYRAMHGIADTGTAVTVQTMVFGNAGATSGSGVAFSRDPSSGADRLYVEFLYNAQGEDVVSGARTPDRVDSLERSDPEIYARVRTIARQLERHFGDMQDLEFTVEDGELYVLQARTAKRSPQAALRVALDMVESGWIDIAEAVQRLQGLDPRKLRERRLQPAEGTRPAARATVASPGAAAGEVVFSAADAVELGRRGGAPILVREETQTEDIAGMEASVGLLTARGGTTSHAAVIARHLGLPCLVGCEDLVFHATGKVTLGGRPLAPGEALSLDGESGQIYRCRVPIETLEDNEALTTLRRLAASAGVSFPL